MMASILIAINLIRLRIILQAMPNPGSLPPNLDLRFFIRNHNGVWLKHCHDWVIFYEASALGKYTFSVASLLPTTTQPNQPSYNYHWLPLATPWSPIIFSLPFFLLFRNIVLPQSIHLQVVNNFCCWYFVLAWLWCSLASTHPAGFCCLDLRSLCSRRCCLMVEGFFAI